MLSVIVHEYVLFSIVLISNKQTNELFMERDNLSLSYSLIGRLRYNFPAYADEDICLLRIRDIVNSLFRRLFANKCVCQSLIIALNSFNVTRITSNDFFFVFFC